MSRHGSRLVFAWTESQPAGVNVASATVDIIAL
jgi:hypothetical protein